MARYIDADALIEALQADFEREGAKADDMAMRGLADVSVKYSHGQFCFLNAIEQVKITPSADVVTKSEVEKIFEEIETCMKDFEDDDDGYLLKKCEFEFFMREIRDKYTENENG